MPDTSNVKTISSAPSSASTPLTTEEKLAYILDSPDFTVAEYLNTALADASASNDPDALQQRMAELALQLQVQTQSYHDDIGRIGAEMQAILPRCAADVGRIGVGLEGMRSDAQALLESTAMTTSEEGEDVSSSLETLSTLHALQSNLSKAKDILTAAATWDTTLSSIPPLLAQQNLTEAVEALAKLEHGERALRGMPNPEERQESIAKVRMQVQVMLQPQLKHALQNMNTRLAPLQHCVSLYTKLGIMDSLKDEYVKNRPGNIHKAWFAFKQSYDSASTDGVNKTNNNNEQQTSSSSSTSFLEWLPTWYDSILSLLTEERRQSSAAFGAEIAPEMVAKVLAECFRPILSSFKSRVEALFPSSPAAISSKGSFESVCAVYESTLQFLSLAYELVAGGYLDVAEAGLTKSDGSGLYKEMEKVFKQVATPFVAYQQRFAELEAKSSKSSTQLVAKDIQQAVSAASSAATVSLEKLQDASERLKGLAPFIFPLADRSLARFELLTCGHNVLPSMSTVDKILSGHASELGIAVQTLSAAMNADSNRLSESFDEQHVLCALEFVKIAGSFRRDLRSFEEKARDRIAMLSERLATHLAQQSELFPVEKATKKRAKSFVLPDSLSAVEIDSILTSLVFSKNSDDDINDTLVSLQRLADSAAQDLTTTSSLFPESNDALKRFASSCHTFVFNVCSAVPRKHLANMSSMSCWKSASTDTFDSYGTLPQQYITHVGEHMLALVQALEPFASDQESLALANEVMEGVRNVALQAWREFISAAGYLGADSVVEVIMNGKRISDLVLSNAALDEEEALEDDMAEEEKESAIFCNAWLDVVGLAVTGRLLERIMRIPQLTTKGCEHLSADLNYLVNVFSALGVAGHPHPLISHLADFAIMPDADLKAHIGERNKSDDIESVLRAVEVRISLLRGIPVS